MTRSYCVQWRNGCPVRQKSFPILLHSELLYTLQQRQIGLHRCCSFHRSFICIPNSYMQIADNNNLHIPRVLSVLLHLRDKSKRIYCILKQIHKH